MNTIPLNKPIEYSTEQDFLNHIYKKLGHSNLFDKNNNLYFAKDGTDYSISEKKEIKVIKLNPLEGGKN